MTKFVNAITQTLSDFDSPDFGIWLGSAWTQNDEILSTDSKMQIFLNFFPKLGLKFKFLT